MYMYMYLPFRQEDHPDVYVYVSAFQTRGSSRCLSICICLSDKRITPMQRVIGYMKKRGLRPTELFRSMDKQVANKITHQEMIVRLKVQKHLQLPIRYGFVCINVSHHLLST